MSLPVTVPAAAAAAADIGDVTGMIGGLGNRLTICRSARHPDQAHSRRHDYCEHNMTHVDSSYFNDSESAVELERSPYHVGKRGHQRHKVIWFSLLGLPYAQSPERQRISEIRKPFSPSKITWTDDP